MAEGETEEERKEPFDPKVSRMTSPEAGYAHTFVKRFNSIGSRKLVVENWFATQHLKWVIPQRVSSLCFVGKEVVCVAHDLYIMFLNVRTGLELVYKAGGGASGDGVDVVTGHKSPMFAFAEKVHNARIFIISYPSFTKLIDLTATDVNRYKALCLMEGDMVAGFSGFPNYIVSIWSWRTGQRLITVPTDVVRRTQIYAASHSHMTLCECYGEGLIVWEVAPCFKHCFIIRRSTERTKSWVVADPPAVDFCWTIDDSLYSINAYGHLQYIQSDGIKMINTQEWSEEISGDYKPCICAFGNGILVYGPDNNFRWLKKIEQKTDQRTEQKIEPKPDQKTEQKSDRKSGKKLAQKPEQKQVPKTEPKQEQKIEQKPEQKSDQKNEKKWRVVWTQAGVEDDEVLTLVSNAAADVAAAWTRRGRLLRIVLASTLVVTLPRVSVPVPTARQTTTKRGRGRGARARSAARRRRGASPKAATAAATAASPSTAAPAPVEDNDLDIRMVCYKQRGIARLILIAPDFKYLATMNESGEICVYDAAAATLILRKQLNGSEMSMNISPVEPIIVVFGAVGPNYGLALLQWEPPRGASPQSDADALPPSPAALSVVSHACLTHQAVTRVVFSPTGRELIAAAMAAGHIFIYKVDREYKLLLVRYAELGRGLADCFLMKVGETMRAFCLVLFSDKYLIGERIICVNAETGKDNKFAGKMQGPYSRLLPLSVKDTMMAIPYLSRSFHVLKLSGDKGVTVSVKMGPIVESHHDLKQFSGMKGLACLLTFGADGAVVLRSPDGSPGYEFKMPVSHRYEGGVKYVSVDSANRLVAHMAVSRTCALTYRHTNMSELRTEVRNEYVNPALFNDENNTIELYDDREKNYLDVQEEKKVREESIDYKTQRDEVVRVFESLQKKLVALLEENIAERPLHQLSLSEFNLHMEHKKERLKQAEKEREEIRLNTEAKIRAQDKVTAWIKSKCWDTMLTPRVKLFAIFSHYQVENYPVLPTQRDQWPELQQTMALRNIEKENDADLFRPWEEPSEVFGGTQAEGPAGQSLMSVNAGAGEARLSDGNVVLDEVDETPEGEPYVLSGTSTHKYVTVPPAMIPQTLTFSFLQMNWLHHLVKLNVQNMRLWFNKQFDEMMNQKKREIGLVKERNTRLRFILEELNKLSDLRGSFHHMMIVIRDPEWRQDEEPIKLIKVEPEECTIPPYISPSQIVVVPPDPGPKDDFRERALNEMMDGVLEKLWHEEIKKPIPKPQCMLDKEPEHWNEEDLRQVFDYEAKVKFRVGEREKYRKMLHAEYAKLSQVLNEGVVKFNLRVKDLWLTKLKVDSVIGQENLNLMRLRRENLDRVESSEKLEDLRHQISQYESEAEVLQRELTVIAQQGDECQAAYDALAAKDRHMDRAFKNHFADLSPVVVEQCYKFFKKRPKWQQRASMIPAVLYEMASAALTGIRPPNLHPDCIEYLKGIEQLDLLTNMPAVMDEGLWANMCRLRRTKIENEIRMRAVIMETAYVDHATATWNRALVARKTFLQQSAARIASHRELEQDASINRTLQLVLPAGQVEIITTGHLEDFDDATLIPKNDVDVINELILKVGAIKLRMMRRQMEFRKKILAKEWEHAQMKMKLRHMQEELYTYGRLKIPKELQYFLKNKEKGYTDEQDYVRLEKEMAATKMSIERVFQDSAQYNEELQVKISTVEGYASGLQKYIDMLTLKASEKRLNEDALEPIRIRRILKMRMETLVARSFLIREVQANHTRIVLLQTELELLRLRTYPTLATFRTFC